MNGGVGIDRDFLTEGGWRHHGAGQRQRRNLSD
jgi:hypothetical protein